MITQEEVKKIFDYEDGDLIRLVMAGCRKPDQSVGSKNNRGYINVVINRKIYTKHRIIFLWHHGYFPKFVDHIDGNKDNNNIDNLRGCTSQQNSFNVGITKRNRSGIKGVSWCKARRVWSAAMSINRKYTYLGGFWDIEVASQILKIERLKHHGEFANDG